MSDLTDDLADVRTKLLVMAGDGEYRLPLDRFQPTEHERTILLRLLELTEIVGRLAERIETDGR